MRRPLGMLARTSRSTCAGSTSALLLTVRSRAEQTVTASWGGQRGASWGGQRGAASVSLKPRTDSCVPLHGAWPEAGEGHAAVDTPPFICHDALRKATQCSRVGEQTLV